MALVNPNIALAVKPIELQDPMAQYGKLIAIQNAQNQNRLADMQMAEYERARTEEQGLRNFLAKADFTKPETRTGLYQFGKTGRDYIKTLAEQEAAAATLAETKSKTTERDYKLRVEKANKAISDIAALNTPEEAIASIDAHLKNGDIDENKANMLKGRLAAAPSFGAWQKDMLVNILDAKEKLTMTMPKVARQDVGGQIITIQDNPMLPGYGLPVQSMAPIKKTATIADNIAQQRLGIERDRLAQEATGVVYQEDANGNVIALPSKLKKGEVPVARVAVAPGGGFQALQGKPSEAVGKELMSINQQKAVLNSAIKYLDKAPEAFGFKRGMQGELVGTTLDTPEQIEARSYVYNVVSNVIKERAGTAQTAGEKETLYRFLPSEYDNASEIKAKFTAFQQYLADKETGTSKKRGGGTPPKPAAGGSGVDTNNPLLK